MTMSGTVVGTPSYMPPEQASGKIEEVSPRSDVYSIGAILYELVTGRPPFRASSPFETVKQVLESEPVSPRLLNPGVPVDLETICLKALRKEQSRRYQSAQDLADELERYLAGEPILARPVGPYERVWRWCRRNPRVAILSAFLILSMFVALGGTTTGLVIANAERRRAEEEKQRAEDSLRLALGAVDDLLTEVGDNTLLNQPGMRSLQRQLLEKARDYYQQFLEQSGNDEAIQDELAKAHFRVGFITENVDSPDKALAEYDQARTRQEKLLAERPADPARLEALGNTWNAIGRASVRLADFDQANKAYQEAIKVRQQLVDKVADQPEYRRLLANAVMNKGLVPKMLGGMAASEAAAADDEAAAAQHEAAAAGYYKDAERQYNDAQDIRREALDRAPGQPADLKRDLAKGAYNLASLAFGSGQFPKAQRFIDAAIAGFKELLDLDPEVLENQQSIARCMRLAGDIKYEQEEFDQALPLYEQARQRIEQLATANPLVVTYQGDLAGVYLNIGYVLLDQEKDEPALDAFRSAVGIFERLSEQGALSEQHKLDLENARWEIDQLAGPSPASAEQTAP